MIPRATMRLQLHKGFTFADAAKLIPYIRDLGISHVYSSPILTARAGSIHGYDIVDPTTVNPELGGETGFRDLVSALRQAGLGLIVDIVPNHMAVGGSDNPWWTEMLRHGQGSRYATFFDVDWNTEDADLRGKVLAPFLGKPYGQALEDGEIQLGQTASGEPVVRYYESEFPIDPADYAHICEAGTESFDPANHDGRSNLHALLERQHYRLAWWATAGDEINWRRFFDINGLAGLRIEVPEVFEEAHATLFRLYKEGLIDGFRVDHVDGLSDPPEYCRRLRQRLEELSPGRRAYLVVEKILGAGEPLPTDWGVDGTSGYDFMNEVSALQHDSASSETLGQLWHSLTQRAADFEAEEISARKETLERGFDAQLNAVVVALHRVARSDLKTRDISAAKIRQGLIALLSHFPVYRNYDARSKRSPIDQASFTRAFNAAKAAAPVVLHPVLAHLDRWLGEEPGDKVANTRFQQLSAPVAAKSVEDTTFYRYGRLLSRNDVGFDAARLGSSVTDFHHACIERMRTFPNAMLATATHDHKRGEDLRARLAVISEIPDAWATFLAECRAHPVERPDPADEIMLYQMIVGGWPLDLKPDDTTGCKAFAERLAGWQEKALREAKLRTDWTTPNEAYEHTAREFLFSRLAPGSEFLSSAQTFIESIAPAGAVNGLVQAVLKMTVPGMPDFYQGTEFWDFSLVDPDNRRPVDYDARQAALATRAQPVSCLPHWRDGHVKQAVIEAVLRIRQLAPGLFERGDYVPLSVNGALANHVLAFARHLDNFAVIVVVPRFVKKLVSDQGSLTLNETLLRNNAVSLPNNLRSMRFQSLFGGGQVELASELQVSTLFSDFPLAILYAIEST